VTYWFCTGCRRQDDCLVHLYPKTRPDVSRFLQRFNLAKQLNQQLWGSDYRTFPIKEWRLLQVAMQTINECDAERIKRIGSQNA